MKKILQCRDLIEHQILWKPRMGSSNFWYDNWTGIGALYFNVPPHFPIDESVNNVREVVDEGLWEEDRLRMLLPNYLADHIVEHIQPPVKPDILNKHHWMMDTRGTSRSVRHGTI